MKNKKYRPYLADMAPSYLTHLGLILSNLSILFLILTIVTFFVVFIPVLYYLIIIAIIPLTIGTVFIVFPNYFSLFTKGADIINALTPVIEKASPLFLALTAITLVVSTILLLVDKKERHTGRLVYSFSIFAVVLVALIGIIGGAV